MSDNEIAGVETISIPATAMPNSKDNVFRLCEYETESQKGCRRTNTMLALEAEFDTFVDPEMFWGVWDQFCIHEGKSYYYKSWIQENISRDLSAPSKPELETILTKVTEQLGYKLGYDNLTFDTIKNLFTNNTPGLPKLIIETPQFLQCEDVGKDKITIDSLDRTTLNLIKQTFTGDVHPLMTNVADSLHIKDGKVFCTDVFAYEHNPNGRLGVLMVATETEKYQAGKPYFFPFETLSEEQIALVKTIGSLENEASEESTIINL